jgi:hypothetical protein
MHDMSVSRIMEMAFPEIIIRGKFKRRSLRVVDGSWRRQLAIAERDRYKAGNDFGRARFPGKCTVFAAASPLIAIDAIIFRKRG